MSPARGTSSSTSCSATCDFVSVHTPLTPETQHLIGAEGARTSCNPMTVLVNYLAWSRSGRSGPRRRTRRGTYLRRRTRRVRGGARGASRSFWSSRTSSSPHTSAAPPSRPATGWRSSRRRISWPYCAVRSRRPQLADNKPGDDGAGRATNGRSGCWSGASAATPGSGKDVPGGPYPLAGPDTRERRSATWRDLSRRGSWGWPHRLWCARPRRGRRTGHLLGHLARSAGPCPETGGGDGRRGTLQVPTRLRRTISPRSRTLRWTS